MAKGLLMTVGTSASSEIYCVRELAPDWVAFLCTEGSSDTINSIVSETGLTPNHYRWHELPDSPDAAGELLHRGHELYRWLHEKCGDDCLITINPTAGRKWMSMALGVFGARTSAHQIYVHVDFRDGKPDPETMRIVNLGDVEDHTAFHAVDIAVSLFNRYDFEAAARLLGQVNVRSSAAQTMYRALSAIACELERWDRFEHYASGSRIADMCRAHLNDVRAAARDLGLSELISFCAQLDDLLSRIQAVETCQKPNLLAVADLVNNARRRIQTNRIEDGVARLYRALEATAQSLLFDCGINTSAIDWTSIPPEQQAAFKRKARLKPANDLPDKLGLTSSFMLAHVLGLPGSAIFFNQQGEFTYKRFLEHRNASILAHGWSFVQKEHAEKFLETLAGDLNAHGVDLSGWDIPELPRLWK